MSKSMTDEERLKKNRKRKARKIQAENPDMKYIVAWRQVVATEEDKCPHDLLGKDSCW